MHWIEGKDEENKEFIQFIKGNNHERRSKIMKLLDKHSYKNIHIFKAEAKQINS